METKQCSKCGEVKPISEYGMLRGKVGGMSYCKVCGKSRSKKYNQENPDKVKQYYLDNKERICKRVNEYNKNNPERKEYMKKYYQENKKDLNEKERVRRYNKYHSDQEYRFKELMRDHLKGVKNRQEFKVLWDDVRKDYDEKGIKYHIDHLVPKNWFKMNCPKYLVNHIDNLQVIDAEYNLSKQDRWSDPVPSDYLDKIRPYIKKKFQGLLKSL